MSVANETIREQFEREIPREDAEIGGDTAMHRRSLLMEASRSAAARFIRVGRRRAYRAAGRVLLGSLVCAATMMSATSARAQQVTRTQDYDNNSTWNDINQCNGAAVNFQGHTHFQNAYFSNGDFSSRIQQDGKSTASSDAAAYQYNFYQDTRFRSSTSNYVFTFQTRKHIIRKGGGPAKDSWFITEQFTVTPNSFPQRNDDKTVDTCK
jgi:hypothetical protein